MNSAHPVTRLIAAWRNYGPGVTARIFWSKLRGTWDPARALPAAPLPRGDPRMLSLLLHTSLHETATVERTIGMLLQRGGTDWELCLCVHSPLEPATARLVASVHGQPGFRIVTVASDRDLDAGLGWTVEQATGRFVALLASDAEPSAPILERLLQRAEAGWSADPTMLVQRKGDFLASYRGILLPEAMDERGPRLEAVSSTTP